MVDLVKQNGLIWIDKMLKTELTNTKAGSISYLFYGEKPSEQSINIKLGHFGEFISKINNKNKDIDLIFKNENDKIIYYRELKGNIELDTEKLPATINKCYEIEKSLKDKYKDYIIDCGILNWSIYNRKILKTRLSNIKTFEKAGIKIDHMQDLLLIIDITWNEEDYYQYFKDIGDKIKTKFNNS